MSLNSQIADLILEKGRAQAQGAAASGQAWGSALSQIGQQVGQTIGSIPRVQEQAAQTAEAQRARASRDTFASLLKNTPLIEQDGAKIIDLPSILTGMNDANYGPEGAAAAQHVNALNEGLLQAAQGRLKAVTAAATGLRASGDSDKDLALHVIDLFDANHTYPEQLTKKLRSDVEADPATAIPKLTSMVLGAPKLEKVGPNESLVNPNNPTKPVFTAPPKPGEGQHVVNGQILGPDGQPVGAPVPKQVTPLAPEEIALKNQQIAEIDAKLKGTIPMSEKDKAELGFQRARLAAEVTHWNAQDAANEAAPTLSPDALKLTAHQFAMTGQLPPMGMGKQGAKVRTDIINQAAAEYKNLDLPSQIASYNANKSSLKNVTGTLDTLTAFENTAGKNLKQFVDLAAKIPDTGVPWLNTPIRAISDKMLGSEDMKAAKAAGDVALREIARVTNDPKLSGVLSDDARKSVNNLISSGSATLPQILAVAKVLQSDMANVHSSLGDQKTAIEQRIATPPGEQPKPAAATAPASAPMTRTIRNTSTGETKTQTSTDGGVTWK